LGARLNHSGLIMLLICSAMAFVASSGIAAPLFSLYANFKLITNGTVAVGDYNNDGRLDIVFHGLATNGYTTEIWTNGGSGFGFFGTPFAGSYEVTTPAGVAFFARDVPFNIALGRYDSQTHTPLPQAISEIVTAGDIFNRGQMDRVTAGWFDQEPLSGFPAVGALTQRSSIALGDYDNDGFLDLLYSTYPGITRIIRGANQSSTNFGLTGVTYGSAVWGDYDNDGLLDILLCGATNFSAEALVSQVWRNTGSGFSNINLSLPGVMLSSVAWADFDADGRLDFLLTGTTSTNGSSTGAICQLWRNTGTGFELVTNSGLPAVSSSSIAWADFDNDGRLDLLLTGMTPAGPAILQVWKNLSPAANTSPIPPSGLTVVQSNGSLVFSWGSGSDAETPQNVLTYNLRVGTTSGGESKVASMSSGATGFRRVPQPGNRNRTHSWTSSLTNFVLGQSYYWSVQSVDSSFSGSPWAPEKSFRLLQWSAPTIVAPVSVTNLPVGDYNGNGIIDESDLNIVYTNYFATSPWLQMTNVAGLGGTNVTFALTGSLADLYCGIFDQLERNQLVSDRPRHAALRVYGH